MGKGRNTQYKVSCLKEFEMGEIVRRPNSLPSPFSDNLAIVDAFLAAQDVKQSSKETYCRQLTEIS